MSFRLLKNSKYSKARLGVLKTAHGEIKTPFFMPIATRGSVKTLTPAEIKELGAEIVLGNTYHLYLRPGLKIIKKSGGLHRFMDWHGPILTDSGGVQVFSLDNKKAKKHRPKADQPLKPWAYQPLAVAEESKEADALVKVTDKGVEFRSVYDGSKHLFTPKKALEIQAALGSDIRMVLDVCSPAKCLREQAEKDLKITLKWAAVGARHDAPDKMKSKFLLFGIVQGALYKDLRLQCASALVKMNYDGYAVGGLAVGESVKEMYKVLDYTVPELPENKPHYLMGVGLPEQIIAAVKRGIDMFDCVIPTREARHGRLYQWSSVSLRGASTLLRGDEATPLLSERPLTRGLLRFARNDVLKNSVFYQTINIKSGKFAQDTSPINPYSKFAELRNLSKAYLRHLFSVGEPLALRLATLNNLEFYLGLMAEIRKGIGNNEL